VGCPWESGTKQTRSGHGANLGFEEERQAAAGQVRGQRDASADEHVALGSILLKSISAAVPEA
jgi:hypothetical protein